MKKMHKFLNYKDKRNHDIKINIDKFGESEYIKIIEKSFEDSIKNKSNLPEWILNMEGMSGISYRCFINNLIKYLNNSKYLEVGCWKGSTTCSAIFGNEVKSYCIDNWSEFGGPKKVFCENIQKCVNECDDIEIIFEEEDFRKINYTKIGKYNVYFFDGPHGEKDQYDGLMVAQPALDDEFIFICDDWNFKQVREGTKNAFIDNKIEILYSLTIFTSLNGGMSIIDNCIQNSHWHNGYFISICKK